MLFCNGLTKYFVVLLCRNKIFCCFVVLLFCCFVVKEQNILLFCCATTKILFFCWVLLVLLHFVPFCCLVRPLIFDMFHFNWLQFAGYERFFFFLYSLHYSQNFRTQPEPVITNILISSWPVQSGSGKKADLVREASAVFLSARKRQLALLVIVFAYD